jgi:hypothetical protein
MKQLPVLTETDQPMHLSTEADAFYTGGIDIFDGHPYGMYERLPPFFWRLLGISGLRMMHLVFMYGAGSNAK